MPRPVLAVLGGSFNPPHLGHVLIPTYLLSRGLAARVLVAPCWSHPFAKEMAPFERRLAWTQAAMAIHGEAVEVSDLEGRLASARGQGPSYSIELLEAIAAAHPEAEVRLVIGTDIIARGELGRWHRADEVVARFRPIVVPRTGYAPPEACALPEVSSTAIRAWLADPTAAGAREGLEGSLPAALLPLLLEPSPGMIWILGHGHVASHAEPWLRARGWGVRVLGARALADGEVASVVEDEPSPAAIWALCRDPDLPSLARGLARVLDEIGGHEGVPVLHGAGALIACEALGALQGRGNPVATLHPICSLRRERVAASQLGAATFGIEGDPAAREVALRMIGDQPWLDLGGLDRRGRLAYHGACALAANHLAVLEAEAVAVLRGLGLPAAGADAAIAALLRSSLANLLALGIPAGITGPAVRGDRAAIDGHLRALEGPARAVYELLSGRLAALVAGAEQGSV
ncbi:MAG: DUF2520 domain-containing protein [Myxococcales bacterium]|nr:DUF2520 domain-containing protein [Myxococcales bacterium]